MNRLRKIGSKLSLRRKERGPPRVIPASVFEEEEEEGEWQPYDPLAYDRAKRTYEKVEESFPPPRQDPVFPVSPVQTPTQSFEYDERFDQPQEMYAPSGRIPGAPPAIYSEWTGHDGIRIYGTEIEEDPTPQVFDPAQPPPPPPKNNTETDILSDIYGGDALPIFGKQYSMPGAFPDPYSSNGGGGDGGQGEHYVQTTVMHMQANNALNPFEEMIRNADADLQRAYLESLKTAGIHEADGEPVLPRAPGTQQQQSPPPQQQPSPPSTPPPAVVAAAIHEMEGSAPSVLAARIPLPASSPVTPGSILTPISSITSPPALSPTQSFLSEAPPTSCIICTEDFVAASPDSGISSVSPPAWISLACLHPPSTCTSCLQTYITHSLDTKIWNQITCPECSAHLIYDDIQRLADPETFSRYEVMSFRSAVGPDSNFIWCQQSGCDFGQLHDDENGQRPIVRCLKCGFRSCVRHGVKWHERLTCEEYDAMLADPENFESMVDKEDKEAKEKLRRMEEEDERIAREMEGEERVAEEERQRRRHEEERRRERERQEREAERKKVEKERKKKAEELKRRQREEKQSLAKIQSTTKQCPGCQWPIEKNDGCAHMTCTQCRHEFCWSCMKNWRGHGSRCRW